MVLPELLRVIDQLCMVVNAGVTWSPGDWEETRIPSLILEPEQYAVLRVTDGILLPYLESRLVVV